MHDNSRQTQRGHIYLSSRSTFYRTRNASTSTFSPPGAEVIEQTAAAGRMRSWGILK
jgi:hypothetical protein